MACDCCGGLCGGYLFDPQDTGQTKPECEATYDYCVIAGDDGKYELAEDECVSGTLGPVWCLQAMPSSTELPGGCPEGWIYAGADCVLGRCLSSCDDCVELFPEAYLVACGDDDRMCGTHDRTKGYRVWVPNVAPMSLMSVGPGGKLKQLLAKFGIHASPTCKCNKMARQMDAWGPDESLHHIEEIVDVMEEEAKKRGLPFIRAAGRILVRKAIRNSRGNGS